VAQYESRTIQLRRSNTDSNSTLQHRTKYKIRSVSMSVSVVMFSDVPVL